ALIRNRRHIVPTLAAPFRRASKVDNRVEVLAH
ncbi:MAG: hypothetical protein JWR58_3142, partial [Pseudonocardia sp.]|nr:hypothetical protein [Pseudonocardia sp.]